MSDSLVEYLWRGFLGFIVLYLLFWVTWFWFRLDAFAFALFGKDKKFKPTPPASQIDPSMIESRQLRNVVFIRHGESLWNVVFNRSKFPIFFIARLIKSALQEIGLMVKGGKDSLFYDSPLSDVGFKQANELHQHISVQPGNDSEKVSFFRKLLRFEIGENPVIISSNLRRALTTAALVFQERLRTSEEKILLVPHLQEISYNPDALSILPPFGVPSLSWIESKTSQGASLKKVYSTQVDPRLNSGNKSATSTGRDRIIAFAGWLFNQSNTNAVVVGHSLWFLSFFKEFLPAIVTHPAKQKKMSNGAAVGFTIEKLTLKDKTVVYRIVPDSISVVYGKFK